jgi:molybdopterin synthase catalytic subunit
MFELSDKPIETGALGLRLRNARAGALVTFEGWVRNHNEGHDVSHLKYEAYAVMAVKEGRRIVDEARARFDVLAAHCVHRVGALGIGDIAVWVGVIAEHRGPAFEACEYVIDNIKFRVPIWKKEYYTNGDSGWVACHECGHAHARHAPATHAGAPIPTSGKPGA